MKGPGLKFPRWDEDLGLEQVAILDGVAGLLKSHGFSVTCPSFHNQGALEVVRRYKFPVTIRLQFMGGDFVAIISGVQENGKGGCELDLRPHFFEVGDPDFLDHVLGLVRDPMQFAPGVLQGLDSPGGVGPVRRG